MLTLLAGQPECLWDEALPVEVRELPADLAALDGLLADLELLGPIVERWRREVVETGRAVLTDGRPTIAMETYVRLMVLKQRYRWGYRTLVAEVSDSIHLRRFCRISLSERVPDESTVRKLTRRIGAETVNELTRALIVKATREKRFRPRAVRIDSTVIEADVRYPTDSGLAAHGVRALAREGRKLAKLVKEQKAAGAGSLAGDGSQAAGDHPHDPPALGGGEGRGAEADRADRASCWSARSRDQAAGGDRAPAGAWAGREGEAEGGAKLEELADRCEKVASADPPARRGRADQGPARVAGRPRRPADPQGEARQAERVRVRDPALRR